MLTDNIKKIRQENGLTQEDLAEMLGVSRQSVSKWESGGAYPEMDKMLKLCELFGLNMDELLNQEAAQQAGAEEKPKKSRVHRFIRGCFGYLTRLVQLFSAMSLWQKVKCLIEQVVLAGFLAVFFGLLGVVFVQGFYIMFRTLPGGIENALQDILVGLYTLLSLALGVVVLLHIFKLRYLDYYRIVPADEANAEGGMDDDQVLKEKTGAAERKLALDRPIALKEEKTDKIIIRDVSDSFLSWIRRMLLWLLKACALGASLFLCFALFGAAALFAASFTLIKTGTLFFGILLAVAGGAAVAGSLLVALVQFIFGRMKNGRLLGILALSGLLVSGAGCGLCAFGVTEFSVISPTDEAFYTKKELVLPVEEEQSLAFYSGNIVYCEEERDDIRLEFYLRPQSRLWQERNGSERIFAIHHSGSEMVFLQDTLSALQEKKLYDGWAAMYVYASRETLDTLRENSRFWYVEEIEEAEASDVDAGEMSGS